MSGNGEYVANKSNLWTGGVTLPAGSGGGCVYSGPFANMTVNLGPVSLALPGNMSTTNPNNDTGIFSWNPRCLKRDLTDYIIHYYNGATAVLDTILLWDNIADFQLSLQGINTTTGANYLGPHGGGKSSEDGSLKNFIMDQSADHRDKKNQQATGPWAVTRAAISLPHRVTQSSTCTTP